MDFKRALVTLQKSIFCKSIRRLLEAKRVCIGFESHENSLQVSINKRINSLYKTKRIPVIEKLGATVSRYVLGIYTKKERFTPVYE